jgi:hypothetical protein
MASASSLARLGSICAEVGFDLSQIRPSILARMRLLADTTETVNDSERAVRIANDIFRYYDVSKPLKRFTALERRIVVIGTLFSDIGKSGPAGAALAGQQLVAEMFAVECIIDERTSVAQFFEVYFPADAADRARRFEALGLDAAMTMRKFWNLHSAWTLHILQGDGVPIEAVPAAATHHILENVNPDSLIAEDGRFTKYFGKHASFERSEKLVILLDKYDAALRRGHRTHDQTIALLREVIAKNQRFCGDHGFLELIGDLDEVMKVPEVLRRGPLSRALTRLRLDVEFHSRGLRRLHGRGLAGNPSERVPPGAAAVCFESELRGTGRPAETIEMRSVEATWSSFRDERGRTEIRDRR